MKLASALLNDNILYRQHVVNLVFFKFFLCSILFYLCSILSLNFPRSSVGKESGSAGDPGLIPGSERSPGEGNGSPFQYPCWKIPWTGEPGGLQSMGSQSIGHD